eukprot:SAG11_NODE_1661_length_4497_cov_5.237608_1_plen_38_part_10
MKFPYGKHLIGFYHSFHQRFPSRFWYQRPLLTYDELLS